MHFFWLFFPFFKNFFCISKIFVVEESFFNISLVGQGSLKIDNKPCSLLCTVCLKQFRNMNLGPGVTGESPRGRAICGCLPARDVLLYTNPSCTPIYTTTHNSLFTKSEFLPQQQNFPREKDRTLLWFTPTADSDSPCLWQSTQLYPYPFHSSAV